MIFSNIVISLLSPLQTHAHETSVGLSKEEEGLEASQRGRSGECLPKKKRRNRRNRRHHRHLHLQLFPKIGEAPDLGILGNGYVVRDYSCPPDQVCEVDPTSSLGGRCLIAASSSVKTRRAEEFPLCLFTCPDPAVCECYYNSDVSPECNAALATSCRNGDYEKCFPNDVPIFKELRCPVYECIADGGDDYECLCYAYSAYYNFCKELYTGTENLNGTNSHSGYCDDVIETFQTYSYYFHKADCQPNKAAKRYQLISQRYNDCVSNHNSSDEIGYTLTPECSCQMHNEMCKLYMDFYGFCYESFASCSVGKCCNDTLLEGNMTSCLSLISEGNIPKQTSPPSMQPAVQEGNKDNPSPDKSESDLSSSASPHASKPATPSSVASTNFAACSMSSTLFVIEIGFYILNQCVF